MKKALLSLLVLSALVSVSFSLSAKAETAERDNGYVSVNNSTTKELPPNIAEISVNIETSDKSMQKASDENKIIANKVYSSLKTILGKSGDGDYIKTNNFIAKPQYVYTKDNKKVFDKYVVSNSVVIRTKNINLVSQLVDTALAQGATSVGNLQFLVSDYDSACNAALGELTKKAYNQANSVASSINSKITGVKSINATCNPENNQRPYYTMMAKSSTDSESATPIESGKIKIFVNVDASFYVN